jgi:hypothetical protein
MRSSNQSIENKEKNDFFAQLKHHYHYTNNLDCDFLDEYPYKNQHDNLEFQKALLEFKLYINSNDPKVIHPKGRYLRTNLLFNSYYVSRTNEFIRLNNKIDSILYRNGNIAVFYEILKLISECINQLFKYAKEHPVQFMLAFLTLCLFVKAASKEINKNENLSTEVMDILKDKCTHKSFMTSNKPAIRMGISLTDNNIYPVSCIKRDGSLNQDNLQCIKDNDLVVKFQDENKGEHEIHEKKVEQARSKINFNYIKNEMSKIIKSNRFSDSGLAKFLSYEARLHALYLAYTVANYSKYLTAGRCAEHTSSVAIKFFEHGFQKMPKIQTVSITFEIDDHVFLLTNSDAQDIHIKNDPAKVKRILSRIKKGEICDPWNEGLFVEFSKNKNNLYTEDGGAHSLEIVTLTKKFDLSGLPQAASDFLRSELEKYNLSALIKEPKENVLHTELKR